MVAVGHIGHGEVIRRFYDYNPPMMTHEIIGDDMQAVVLTLGAGDEIRADAGAMMFMTEGM